MDERDKIDLIAAILAAGQIAARGGATPGDALGRFRAMRRQLAAESLDGPAIGGEAPDPVASPSGPRRRPGERGRI